MLYSTNTFHISGLELQLSLPQLVPAQHLARITSLELLWKLNNIQPRNKPRGKDYAQLLWEGHSTPDSPLHVLCGSIPKTFPHLRSLYISFQCWLNSPPGKDWEEDIISEVETIYLGPVENMLREYSGSLRLNVAIQSGAWFTLLDKYYQLLGAGLKLESVDGFRGRFWKPLSREGGDDEGLDNGDDGFGYWICTGWDDVKAIGHGYWIVCNWGQKWRKGFGTAM